MNHKLIKLFVLTGLIMINLNTWAGEKKYLDETMIEQKIEKLLVSMTLEEKVSLLHGNGKFFVAPIERLNIPSMWLSDGPHGVREEIQQHSWSPAGWTTDSCTYFPTLTALAATWNDELVNKYGRAVGQEARYREKDIILGPGFNIMRTPVCGRNFEYMGEDPYLISRLAVKYVKSVQKQGVAACAKHFALNNQEFERNLVDVLVDERALREIYLPAFHAVVKEGGVLTIMGSYNKFRGQYACENEYLIKDILKGEWGFSGMVISDWAATHSTVISARNGLDLEMGTEKDYEDFYFADPLLKAVEDGEVNESVIDDKVRRILRVMLRIGMFDSDRKKGSFTTTKHFQVAREVAGESIVLLKNENSLLPLNKNTIKTIGIIGDNATRRHASGGYSSGLKTLYEVTPLQGIRKLAGDEIEIIHAQGYYKYSNFELGEGLHIDTDEEKIEKLMNEAVEVAKRADVVIFTGGLNHDYDTEGRDRDNMKLPYNQNELIKRITAVNPNTIVALISGSPVETYEWMDKTPVVLQCWYNGSEGGNALADVIFGKINPSGKLPFTFPVKLGDSPAHKLGEYPGENHQVKYNEGIFVGYRYYDTYNVEPQFCFGHGLSYTRFEYENVESNGRKYKIGDSIKVELIIKNSGMHAGAEVIQLYVHDKESKIIRSVKELKGFKKVHFEPGATGIVSFTLDQKAFAYFDKESMSWKVEPGEYELQIGSSSRDIRQKITIKLVE